MSRALLLQNFDRISEAPGAIPQLRRFIVDLAVRGKLVDQDPTDRPASELIELLDYPTHEARQALPANWIDCKIGELMAFHYGKPLPINDRRENGRVAVFGSNGIVGYCEDALSEDASIIVGRKGSAGALNLSEGPSWTTDVAYYVIPPSFLDIRFLLLSLQSLNLDSLGKGIKPGLSRSEAYQLTLCVPPLAEQRRIVAKSGELIARCDQLEAIQMEREYQRDRLVAASLHKLKKDSDAETFRDGARFYFNHLPALTTCPDQIKQLRQLILDLAVRGRLVSKEPSEPAPNCPDVSIPSFKSSDVSKCSGAFESLTLPLHWSVKPLVDVSTAIVDCPHSTPKWTSEGMMCVRTSQFRPGHLDLSDVRFVSESTYLERVQRLTPMENDILYSREGGILGVACRIPRDTRICLGQRMMLIRPSPAIESAYLEMVLNSPLITGIALEETTGGAAPRVNVSTVKGYPIPLPPVEEQGRIIARVGQLVALCDHLEAQLTATQAKSRRLLDAILYEALNPATLAGAA